MTYKVKTVSIGMFPVQLIDIMQEFIALGKELAAKLKGIENEVIIKELCDEVKKTVYSSSENEGTIKNRMVVVRKQLKAAYPDTETQQHPWQQFTNSGKGNIERWEHLAFKYLPAGDKKQSEQQSEQQINIQPDKQLNKQSQSKAIQQKTTLDDMNISQLQLDAETQQIVESAIVHSGMSLADFVRRACQVYAKTVTGKHGQYESDLTAVPTEELLTSATYRTHPGRAEELTRRAIYALETHNNNCTEKSQKWMITQTAIQSLTGSKPATIKAILERYQTRLDDHNNIKHELNPYDNRKPGRKIDDEIDLATLVPDGTSLV